MNHRKNEDHSEKLNATESIGHSEPKSSFNFSSVLGFLKNKFQKNPKFKSPKELQINQNLSEKKEEFTLTWRKLESCNPETIKIFSDFLLKNEFKIILQLSKTDQNASEENQKESFTRFSRFLSSQNFSNFPETELFFKSFSELVHFVQNMSKSFDPNVALKSDRQADFSNISISEQKIHQISNCSEQNRQVEKMSEYTDSKSEEKEDLKKWHNTESELAEQFSEIQNMNDQTMNGFTDQIENICSQKRLSTRNQIKFNEKYLQDKKMNAEQMSFDQTFCESKLINRQTDSKLRKPESDFQFFKQTENQLVDEVEDRSVNSSLNAFVKMFEKENLKSLTNSNQTETDKLEKVETIGCFRRKKSFIKNPNDFIEHVEQKLKENVCFFNRKIVEKQSPVSINSKIDSQLSNPAKSNRKIFEEKACQDFLKENISPFRTQRSLNYFKTIEKENLFGKNEKKSLTEKSKPTKSEISISRVFNQATENGILFLDLTFKFKEKSVNLNHVAVSEHKSVRKIFQHFFDRIKNKIGISEELMVEFNCWFLGFKVEKEINLKDFWRKAQSEVICFEIYEPKKKEQAFANQLKIRSDWNEHVSVDLMPIQRTNSYEISPTIDQFRRMNLHQLERIPNLIIKNQFGQIAFLECVDVTEFNFDKWVQIREDSVVIYPPECFNQTKKPKSGNKLNQRARITYFNPNLRCSDFSQFERILKGKQTIYSAFKGYSRFTGEAFYEISQF